ncbi:D-alanyl-D-alanine carboxypeptidase precursor [Streptomyces sp. YIM 121038]|uniref:D-alanyl-D-alanine carboxypeptidase n=1 Tax=Streptomyces sp. YIM 121038 TaxID=2136401 RepID=UPI0011623FAF|nr:D-alanyl-D-alanine carboxypeptidase [Streptomyces sp. YIM 121038]QCX77255.1 D-alanyl-D-alanine carboxypeptidase precursor [Streptomyces sp. YIM 121038]
MAGEYPDSSKTVSGGGASEDDAAASPPTPPSAGAANGDARLRNAVAAWVATADAKAEGGEDESGSPAGGDVSPEAADAADRASDEGADEAVAESASGDAPGASDAPKSDTATAVFRTDRPRGGTSDEGADGSEAASRDASDAPKSDTATAVFRTDRPRVETSGDGGAEAGEPPADKATAVFKTVPSWAKKDEAEDAEPEAAADSDAGSGSGERPADQATAVFKAVVPDADAKAGEAKPGEGKAAAADPRTPRGTKSEGTESGEAKSGEADKSGAAEPGDAKSGDAKPEGAKSGDAKAEGAKPGGAKAEGAKSGGAKPGGAKAEGAKSGDAKPEGVKPGGVKPEGVKPGDAKPEGAESAGAKDVDQATAVFKAVKPTGPGAGSGGVDQPTTMLKLGDVKGEKPKAESESERTSKFVALKPLDEPRATPERKAPPQGAPKAPAAAAQAPQAPKPEPAERTTQQPLPPKPPLDLLAELTNTPPPPETPTRTLVRRFKIWTPLVALLAIVFAVVQAVRPLPDAKLSMTAKDTFSFGGGKPSIPWPADGQAAMDVDGIGTFGTSGKPKPVPIASIAKVMTTYLILRDHPIKKGTEGKTLTVDAQAQRHYEKGKPENESVVKVTEGQKIKQYEALQAVMLPSANNVARMLARWDSGGDEKKFVAKMNKTAKELGMTNTHYTDPSGLDKTTVSTAEDLVKLGRVAMENPTFKEIARQPKYEDLNGDEQKNYFGLVPTVAIGIKTGTTTAAGGNILFAAEKKVGGKTQVIIGAALAQFGKPGVANIDQVTKVVEDLISGGQDALTAKTVVKKGTVVGHVDDGLGGETPVVTTKDVTAVGWSGLTAKLELTDGGKKVPHTAKKGTKVGVLSVGDGTNGAIKVPVALGKDLAEPGLGAKLTRIG